MKMPGAAYELGYVNIGVELLDAYLQSDELYWAMAASPPAGEPPYRQLTLGGLLLNACRLQGRQLPPAVDHERQECLTSLQDAISRRPVAWERKATREYQARLKLWGDFLQEYRDDPENHAGRYAYEVERRVMLQLLEPYARDVHRAERELLDALDGILKVAFVPGKFIWNVDTIRAFPKDTYWYLFGDLRK